jgi:hypothetical protein
MDEHTRRLHNHLVTARDILSAVERMTTDKAIKKTINQFLAKPVPRPEDVRPPQKVSS